MLSVLEKNELLEEAERLYARRDYSAVISFVSARCRTGACGVEMHVLRALAESHIGNKSEALAIATAVLKQYGSNEDSRSLRRLTNLYGSLLVEFGRLEDAERQLRGLVTRAARAGDQLMVAAATTNLGVVADIKGEWIVSITAFERAAAAYQRLGELESVAVCHHNIGMAYLHLGELNICEAQLLQASITFRARKLHRQLMTNQIVRAHLLVKRGDSDVATQAVEAVIAYAESNSDCWLLSEALRVRGIAEAQLKQHEKSIATLKRALRLARTAEILLLQGEILEEMAVAEVRRQHMSRATVLIISSSEIYRRVGAALRADLALQRIQKERG